MSLIKTKSIQLGWDLTPTNNFTIYQPATPDGTFRIATGNSGSETDVMTVSSDGSVTYAGQVTYSGLGFTSGTVTAPALYSTDDTNTGIYFPAAETIGFSTNGTERVRIDSSGSVGVGTASMSGKFNVLTSGSHPIYMQGNGACQFNLNDGTQNANWGLGVGGAGITGIASPSTYPLVMYTNGLERIRINSAGNVGIGATPSAWVNGITALELKNGCSFTSHGTSANMWITNNLYYNGTNWVYKINDYAAAYQAFQGSHYWYTAPSGTAGANTSLVQNMSLNASGHLSVKGLTANNGANEAALHVVNNTSDVYLYNSYAGNSFGIFDGTAGQGRMGYDRVNHTWTFQTGSTEKFKIDASGNLLVNTSSPLISGNALNLVNGRPGQIAFRHTSQAAGRFWYAGVESGNDVFTLYPGSGGGGVYVAYNAISWTGNSDERLKTDLLPIEDASNKVSKLRAMTGRFKTDEVGVSRSFLIAQDVQAVLPEAVDIKDDEMGTLGLRYTDIIPLLVAAFKELKAENDSLKARLDAAGL